MINLDLDGTYKKDRHWYCDAVAIDFADSTVHLCEITHSKTLQTVAKRLQLWCKHWAEVVAAIRRDCSLQEEWHVVPREFFPGPLGSSLAARIAAPTQPNACTPSRPQPIITLLEKVLPWKYRSWNGEPFAEDGDA